MGLGQCARCGVPLRSYPGSGCTCPACAEEEYGSFGADSVSDATSFGADSPCGDTYGEMVQGFEGMGLPLVADAARRLGEGQNVALGRVERGRGTVMGLLAGTAGPTGDMGATGAAGPIGATGAAGPIGATGPIRIEHVYHTDDGRNFRHEMLPAPPVEVDACPICSEPMPRGWEAHRDKAHPPYKVPWYVPILKWMMRKKEKKHDE